MRGLGIPIGFRKGPNPKVAFKRSRASGIVDAETLQAGAWDSFFGGLRVFLDCSLGGF